MIQRRFKCLEINLTSQHRLTQYIRYGARALNPYRDIAPFGRNFVYAGNRYTQLVL